VPFVRWCDRTSSTSDGGWECITNGQLPVRESAETVSRHAGIGDVGDGLLIAEALQMLAKVCRHPEEFGDGQVPFALLEFAFEGFFQAVEHLCEGAELLVL